jgi:hypothetical protein
MVTHEYIKIGLIKDIPFIFFNLIKASGLKGKKVVKLSVSTYDHEQTTLWLMHCHHY